MEIVLHDYFEYADGGGRLALELARILKAHIGYGFKKKDHPFFVDNFNPEKEYDLKSFTSIKMWKQLNLIRAFLLKTNFLKNFNYDRKIQLA